MKSDFEMITRRFDRAIKIYPIADIHYGAINHQADEWERFVDDLLKDPDAYCVLDGDLINNNTRSAVGSPFTDLVRPRDQKRYMVRCLEPIRDRILCITSGNHERRSLKDADDDPTYDIAAKLDLEDVYRQDAAFLKISVGTKYASDKYADQGRCAYTIAVTHGSGGGIYTGATVNRNERWGNVVCNADCIIVGHTHKGTVTRPSRIYLDTHNNKVVMQDYLVVSCVSWQAYGEYSLQKMLLPSITARPQVLYLSDNPRKKYIEVRW